jgi:D-tyrosyl-tRNA(Tyr) deacylase
VLLGIEEADSEADIAWLVGKISRLRIFDDEHGVMNLDVQQVGGEVLVVSQFTLHASTKKGNRPSYIKAAPEAIARPLYNRFLEVLSETLGQEVPSGEFGADMAVRLCNDGPVTIWIDSQNRE